MSEFLRRVGYNVDKTNFVPISGFYGDNLIQKSDKMPWYSGPTLIEALDLLKQPKRPTQNPLRIPIRDIYKIGGVGTIWVGRVESGILKMKMELVVAPNGITDRWKSIEMHHEAIEEAIPGDIIGLKASMFSGKRIERGYIIGDPKNDPPMITENFTANVIIMNHPGKIKVGYTPIINIHTARVACKFSELILKTDRWSNKTIGDFPEFLKSGDACKVRLVPVKQICVESFSTYPSLGRFVIRDIGRTVGVGVVLEVTKKKCYVSE